MKSIYQKLITNKFLFPLNFKFNIIQNSYAAQYRERERKEEVGREKNGGRRGGKGRRKRGKN